MAAELTEYEQRYLNMLEDLRNSPAIEVLEDEVGRVVQAYGDVPTVFEKLARRYELALDPALQSRFPRFRSLSCLWQTDDELPNLTGEFKLSHLYSEVSAGPLEIAEDFPEESDRSLARELRMIDDQPQGGGFVAMRAQSHVPFPELWYFTIAHGFQRLDIGYAEYFDNLLVTKGVYGWQHLFADVQLHDDAYLHARKRLTTMLQVLPEIFPGHDYEPLRARFAQRLR
ncbi:hypothetical protein AB0I53_45200 [Saccharopolyspora sp. NPDC050389]|uniref:hypothetical protein n=1 Tax=Saccharopolyspora sp. NPDC050389 TaxID=3155516 RepID=UPI003400EA73